MMNTGASCASFCVYRVILTHSGGTLQRAAGSAVNRNDKLPSRGKIYKVLIPEERRPDVTALPTGNPLLCCFEVRQLLSDKKQGAEQHYTTGTATHQRWGSELSAVLKRTAVVKKSIKTH
ncbi:hypothetical protein INR49_011339 [Caranx melampygus]|nr:hypothetical protein INR49_011339 [Caranx melampygus]